MSLIKIVVSVLDELKAENIRIYDLKGISPLFDYMIVATATNNRAASAMVRHIKDETSKNNFDIRGIEGTDGSWVLVDCKDIIVNIFNDEQREYYGLDKLNLGVKQLYVDDILKSE